MAGREKEADPQAVEAFLSALPDAQRAALERLRKQIRAAAPQAVERMGYGMPMFYVGTSPLVGYSAWKNHCSLYGASGTLLETLAEDVSGYETSKGTIRFDPARPLPAAFVQTLVKTRLAEHEARGAK